MFIERRRQRVRQGFWAGCAIAAIVLFVRANDLFSSTRLRLRDIYFVPAEVSDTIVIVALDDASLKQYGRTPAQWSRSVYADLITILDHAGARVVAFDLLFSEETADDALLAEAIQAARQSDTRLRTVVAAAGVHPAAPARDLAGFPQAITFQNAIQPAESFASVIDYMGYVNTFPDGDGVVRHQPTLVQISDQPKLAWSLAVYLAYLRVPEAALGQIVRSENGILHIAQTRRLYVDDLGFWLQNFFGPPSRQQEFTFPVVSLVDVLSGTVDVSQFEDKIVLVGLINSVGIADQYAVPSAPRGQLMSGVEIQANAIESLIQNQPLRTPNSTLQLVIIGFLAIGSSVLYMPLRWYFRFVLWLALVTAGVAGAFLVFSLRQQVISMFDGGLALTLPVILTTGLDITNEINRRRRSEFFLHSVVQVSQQRLVVNRIMPHVAEDVRRIVPSADIAVWRCSLVPDTPQLIYPRPGEASPTIFELAEVARQVSQSGDWTAQRGWIVLPIAWQKRRVGILAVTRPGDNPIPKDSVTLLQALAEQLAPSLENAFLYAEIERQHAIQDAILSGSPAGILVLDHHLYVRRSNDVFDTVFKTAPETYLNQPFSHLLAAIQPDARPRQAIEQALAKGESFRLEVAFEHRTFNLDAAPQPQFELWVLVITEITHLIQLSELKTYMIRMLSHDLGNPLSRILGYGQLLAYDRASLSETHREFVDFIMRDGEEMNRIISDVLNLEHLRSAELTTEHVDLCQLVADLANRHEPEMIQKQHHFSVKTPAAPVIVEGNYRQLSQAIMNLLNNAIKYTPDGGRISIELSSDADRACLSVADTGYGIPQQAHSKIFTEFYRVKSRATVGISGTGLGLSLVKLVIDNHGGRVWFESEEGIGSTFFVELPLEHTT